MPLKQDWMMQKRDFMEFMKNDPFYLSQVLTQEASLGALSVDGNFCMGILTEKYVKVKES